MKNRIELPAAPGFKAELVRIRVPRRLAQRLGLEDRTVIMKVISNAPEKVKESEK